MTTRTHGKLGDEKQDGPRKKQRGSGCEAKPPGLRFFPLRRRRFFVSRWSVSRFFSMFLFHRASRIVATGAPRSTRAAAAILVGSSLAGSRRDQWRRLLCPLPASDGPPSSPPPHDSFLPCAHSSPPPPHQSRRSMSSSPALPNHSSSAGDKRLRDSYRDVFSHVRLIENFVEQALTGVRVLREPPAAPAQYIATHDGSFHCDEALACALLRCPRSTPFHTDAVLRTRKPDWIDAAAAALDVGAVYDPARHRYDHHQKEFTGTMTTPGALASAAPKGYDTRLSSAGLVYKHFGADAIRAFADYLATSTGTGAAAMPEADARAVYDFVYRDFIEHVDGIDNGVEEFSSTGDAKGQPLKRNYRVTSSLSSRVGRLMPRWNDDKRVEDADGVAFLEAMRITLTEFLHSVEAALRVWLPARCVVESALAAAETVHPSGGIVVFPNGGCPWKEHLTDLEKERNIVGRTLYVMFPDVKNGFRVQCVPKEGSSFANRKNLLWAGLRDEELSKASGIPGGVFVHVTGFIGGNLSKEGALQMAVKSLEA